MDYQSGNVEQPSCVLLCGRTDFFDIETIKPISEYYNIVILSENERQDFSALKESRKIHFFVADVMSEKFSRIMYSYTPDVIWYVSGYADGGNGLENETKKIEKLVRDCSVNDVSKLVVVSSLNSLRHPSVLQPEKTDEKEYVAISDYGCAQMEEFVRFCTKRAALKSVIIRTPYIRQVRNETNHLGNFFGQMAREGRLEFQGSKECPIDFLSVGDLTELLISVTEETMDETEIYCCQSGFQGTYGELGELLKGCQKDLTVTFDESKIFELDIDEAAEAEKIHKSYGYVPNVNFREKLSEDYECYRKQIFKKNTPWDKVKGFTDKLSKMSFVIIEAIVLFALVQFLLRFTADSVFFRYVDIQLFYVIIMGIMHGLGIGFLAGILQCVSLIYEYSQIGVTGTMLFYNMDYWLPFSIYIMAGAITGYIMSSKNQKLKFAEDEISTIQDKYSFLNKVYLSVIDNKEEYKRQILGYQDSFGKIFHAVEKLNSSIPANIFMNGVNTLEHILNNNSIAIYTLDEYQKYGRLVACSREMNPRLKKSIFINEYQEVYDVILGRETWKNTEFRDEYPAYAFGIIEDHKVRLMICLYDVAPDQMGLYYMNLFTIMGNLIRVAFKRALRYQEAIEDEKFYEGTEIIKPDYFEKELESQRKMADAGVSSYMLLKLTTSNVTETSRKLQGLIRHGDMVGQGENQDYYLLLTQTNREIFKIIGERLEGKNIQYTIVEGI